MRVIRVEPSSLHFAAVAVAVVAVVGSGGGCALGACAGVRGCLPARHHWWVCGCVVVVVIVAVSVVVDHRCAGEWRCRSVTSRATPAAMATPHHVPTADRVAEGGNRQQGPEEGAVANSAAAGGGAEAAQGVGIEHHAGPVRSAADGEQRWRGCQGRPLAAGQQRDGDVHGAGHAELGLDDPEPRSEEALREVVDGPEGARQRHQRRPQQGAVAAHPGTAEHQGGRDDGGAAHHPRWSRCSPKATTASTMVSGAQVEQQRAGHGRDPVEADQQRNQGAMMPPETR